MLLAIFLTAGLAAVASSQNINYFGVAFSPYVKNPPYPQWDTYTLEEIKQMLRIILTNNRHNSVSTYGMGVADYNNEKPWYKCDSNALIARAAAQINGESRTVRLSVSQGIHQIHDQNDNVDWGLMNREISNAFSAAADANGISEGTVWGLVFTNEWVTNSKNGPAVLKMIKQNKARAHEKRLQVGTRVHTCGEILGGPNQNILKQIAKESDFIMCNLYPVEGSSNVERAIQGISEAYYKARGGFLQENSKLEVMIGETGWPSDGQFNRFVNNVDNQRRFWEAMRNWSQQNRVKVQMFEAFDEPWKGENGRPSGEKHFGWWYRPNNNEAKYIEKATGKVFQ